MEEKAKETLRHFDSIFDTDTLKNIDLSYKEKDKVFTLYLFPCG